jgi:NDP-sugar pyrophosphorylase family protein
MRTRIGAIAVGGQGTRFGERGVQKCLCPLDGEPLLSFKIDAFIKSKINTIFVLTGFHGDTVNEYLSSLRIPQCCIRSLDGGTDGEMAAVAKLRSFVNEDFVYCGGECIYPASTVGSIIRTGERRRQSIAVMAVSRHDEVAPGHARVAVEQKGMRITGFSWNEDHRQHEFTVIGLYYFRPGVFDALESVAKGSRNSTEFLRYTMDRKQRVTAMISEEDWFCIHEADDVAAWRTSRLRRDLAVA